MKPEYSVSKLGQLPLGKYEELREEAADAIGHFAVCMIQHDDLIGSGTLVNVGGRYGILTAHHVSRTLFQSDDETVGLSIATHPHRFLLKTCDLTELVLGRWDPGRPEDEGPDLAFIDIADLTTLSTLKSKRSFYFIDRPLPWRFDEMDNRYLANALWFLIGVPAEMIVSSGRKGTTEHLLATNYLLAEASYCEQIYRGEHDYVTVAVSTTHEGFCSNYEGMSGGGIWIAPLVMNPDKGMSSLSLSRSILAGVAFYQSEVEGDERRIRGHGPRSIYQEFRNRMHSLRNGK